MKKPWARKPFSYFITFSTYGTWLHGTDKGSVDKHHNQYASDLVPLNTPRKIYETRILKNAPVALDENHRKCVLLSIQDVCAHRHWELHAVHVRSNHVHVVVSAEAPPEKILADFKAYATRGLRKINPFFRDINIWTHHGSTKHIWTRESLAPVLHYVLYEQGKPMQWWCRYDVQSPEHQ